MKICIFTMGNMESRIVLRSILPEFASHIQAIFISSGATGAKREPHIKLPWRIFRTSGARYFTYQLFEGLSFSISNLKNRFAGKQIEPSVEEMAKKLGIKTIKAFNINDEEHFLQIKNLEPELILSIYFDQIVKKQILTIPKFGCVNVHPSLLPEFRGFNPLFWALKEGKKEVGTSLHYMSIKLDAGEVISQAKYQLTASDTLMSVEIKMAKMARELLKDLILQLEKGKIETCVISPIQTKLYSIPTKKDVLIFKENGLNFFNFSDLGLL